MTTSLNYIAGFFDADGSVGVYLQKRSSSVRGMYVLGVSISQKRRILLLDELLERFGGSLNECSSGGHTWWTWRIVSLKALPFLNAIYPFLQNKQVEVALAIEFQKNKRRRGGRNLPLSEEEFAKELRLSNAIKALKRK